MFKFPLKKNAVKNGGFFLIELIVSIFIFLIVMTVSMGALIQALDANRKTQTLKSVMNNLDIVVDSMSKQLAVGHAFRCGTQNIVQQSDPNPAVYGNSWLDCDSTGFINQEYYQVSFASNEDLGSCPGIPNPSQFDVVNYQFISSNGSDTGYIQRTIYLDGCSQPIQDRMTAPEVNITEMTFYVTGTAPDSLNEHEQPQVMISIKGEANAGARAGLTQFQIQTAVSQRQPDF